MFTINNQVATIHRDMTTRSFHSKGNKAEQSKNNSPVDTLQPTQRNLTTNLTTLLVCLIRNKQIK